MATAAATLDPWGRRRLVRTLVTVATAAALLLGGLGYAVSRAIISTKTEKTGTAVDAAKAAEALPPGPSRRDAIAAAPMLAVPPEASSPAPPAANRGPSITIPPAGRVGPANVPTGYPQTPEGAIAQLAAIDTAVLQGMSIERTHHVHDLWAAPGAPPTESWVLTGNVQAFLGTAAGQQAAHVSTTPVAAQVKGFDGPGWVVACVLFDVTARATTQARMAYAHCERMEWSDHDGGRWLIATGTPPSRAPSTWPGTALAQQAGWRTWTSVEE